METYKMDDKALCLAGVVIEVADRMPDINSDLSRAEWRWEVVKKAMDIINTLKTTLYTDDIDDIVDAYLREDAKS